MNIELRPLDESNLSDCINLKVADYQDKFIDTNENSVLAAKEHSDVARPFVIYADGVAVGFTMFAFDQDCEDPDDRYWLWRFMIDEKSQGQGIGREALKQIIAYFKSNGATNMRLSTKESNTDAIHLYESFGFKRNGDMFGGETVFELNWKCDERICQLLKDELLDNGYEYGFYLNGKTYKPDMSNGFDEEFFGRLLTEYRIQDPRDTRQAKVGTCNDIVVLMKAILDEQNVPSKIWLLHDRQRGNFHTVLTFYMENKTVYLELTPQSAKPWYGKEIVFDNEQSFISEYSKDCCEVIEITDSVVIGEAPEFILSRMDQ